MKLFLASADIDEIAWAARSGLLDGVVTSPSLVADSGAAERELLREVARLVPGPVFATVHALDTAAIYRDGKELARLSDHIVVQVPFVEESVAAIRRLCADGVRVAATLVFSAAQALLAAKAGSSSVITLVDDLDDTGRDGTEVVRELRAVFDASATECDVVAFRPATAAQFTQCALSGADAVAMAPDVLRSLLVHPLTDRGMDRFMNELSRQHGTWSQR